MDGLMDRWIKRSQRRRRKGDPLTVCIGIGCFILVPCLFHPTDIGGWGGDITLLHFYRVQGLVRAPEVEKD